MTALSVIIPYFQRKPGILRRALTSVLLQSLPPDIRIDILLVDDGSPVPARGEIEELHIAPPFQLSLAEQPNRGVAAARNTALGLVPSDTIYIAFLDSDDIWDKQHLATGIAALDRGYDFYFCDGRRVGDRHSAFSDATSGVPLLAFLRAANSHLIGDHLYELKPPAFFSQSLRMPGYRIPAVIYRRAAAPSLLFDTSLREAGEDSLFLLRLMLQSRKICCSTRELVTFADGVNIYAGKYTWENPGHLLRHMGIILYYNRLQQQLPLSPDDASFIAGRVRLYHRVFAFLSVRYFVKKRQLWPRDLRRMTRRDPRFWLWFPAWAFYVAVAYPIGVYDPIRQGDIHHPEA